MEESYEEVNKAMKDMAVKASKKGGEALKAIASKEEKRDDKEDSARCRLAYRVFDESMDMYKEGEMSFSEMIEDLNRSLKAID